MSMLRLKATMIGTLAAIIGLSTLFFTVLLSYLGAFNIYTLALFIVLFNSLQWLMAPYLIDLMYRVKKVTITENPELYGIVESLSRKSGDARGYGGQDSYTERFRLWFAAYKK